jgi:hypothetical protein
MFDRKKSERVLITDFILIRQNWKELSESMDSLGEQKRRTRCAAKLATGIATAVHSRVVTPARYVPSPLLIVQQK